MSDPLPPPPPLEKLTHKEPSTISLTYTEYCKTTPNLRRFKVPELKSIAKSNKLHISGSKTVLIERVQSHFRRTGAIIQIQKHMRGFLVRRCFRLRGPAHKDRSLCVNESDFYTLEPLVEIPYQEFFSYTDEQEFTYGFNIQSLITLYKKRGKITNPYNRNSLSVQTTGSMFQLYKLMYIYFPNHVLVEDKLKFTFMEPRRSTTMIPQNIFIPTVTRPIRRPRPPALEMVLDASMTQLTHHMRDMRAKPIEVRIQELFMEIDQLGNYTDSRWFSQMQRREFFLYYSQLSDIWRYRAQLSYGVKQMICPLGNPFEPFPIVLNRSRYDNVSDAEIQLACVTAMENMVCTAPDIEYQKLGALHVLTALTYVSVSARNNLMWLYESLYE